jgi:hypothetical protein
MKLDIKSQNLQEFILKRLGLMRNIKSSEGGGKAHPLQKEQTTKREGTVTCSLGKFTLPKVDPTLGLPWLDTMAM